MRRLSRLLIRAARAALNARARLAAVAPPLALTALVLLTTTAPPAALAAPRLAGQSALENVPGEIVAWQDSVYFVVGHDTTNAELLLRVRRATGDARAYNLGVHRRGSFLSLSPDGRTVLAGEMDSTGARILQVASFPRMEWKDLYPTTDADPHICWSKDAKTFYYQDILDDSLGTPSIFRVVMDPRTPPNRWPPMLFLVGGQRPLISPTGDAIVCVGVDTLRPGPTRDLELRQGVGLEDIQAREYRWIAPLKTWVPAVGGWSPDGERVALVGYGSDSTGAPERRVFVHTRMVRSTRKVALVGDSGRPPHEHVTDAAAWSPDGQWIAVGRNASGGDDAGGVWLITPGGYQSFLLKPTEGKWRGAPLWTGARQFVIADAAAPEQGKRKYWVVEVEEE